MAAFLVVESAGVGGLIVAKVESDPEVAEAAYWVSPSARGRGVATRALRLLSRWAFDEAGVERLWLEIEPGNDASHRVALKAGFLREGVFRAHCRDRRTGVRHDCVIYSLLPGDPASGIHRKRQYNRTREPRGVAQLAEHRSPKPGVAGSSPAAPARRSGLLAGDSRRRRCLVGRGATQACYPFAPFGPVGVPNMRASAASASSRKSTPARSM